MSETSKPPVAEKTNREKSRQPGHPNLRRGGPGRLKGVPNKAAQEMKEMARGLTFGNTKYVEKLRERLESGKCNPAVEVALMHYGYGKPVEKVEVEGVRNFIVEHRSMRPGQDPLAQAEDGEVTLAP